MSAALRDLLLQDRRSGRVTVRGTVSCGLGPCARGFRAGQTFFLEGDECRGVYCIQSGLVGLRRSDEDGNSALLRLSQRGDILGYRALLGKGRHRNTAEVLTHCRACFIEASRLVGLIERNPALREGFLQRALADFTEPKMAALR